jgi:hypothetical protein
MFIRALQSAVTLKLTLHDNAELQLVVSFCLTTATEHRPSTVRGNIYLATAFLLPRLFVLAERRDVEVNVFGVARHEVLPNHLQWPKGSNEG